MRSLSAKALSGGIVVALSAAGLASHECVLLAAAAAAAHRLFLWRMDDGAPWEAWRAGVRCLFAGLFGLLAVVALFAIIAAGLAGYWQTEHHHARATLALVIAAAALLVLIRRGPRGKTVRRGWGVRLLNSGNVVTRWVGGSLCGEQA